MNAMKFGGALALPLIVASCGVQTAKVGDRDSFALRHDGSAYTLASI